MVRIQREDTGHGNDYCQCEIQELEHGHVSIFPGSLAECFFLFLRCQGHANPIQSSLRFIDYAVSSFCSLTWKLSEFLPGRAAAAVA